MATNSNEERNVPTGATAQCRTFAGRLSGYFARASTVSRKTRATWALLTGYERFEQVVSLALTALVSVLIVVTLIRLMYRVCTLLLFDVTDPSQVEIFQSVFGMVMTVLIALEFNHSILSVLERRHGIVKVRTVVLIAILALVRKFIVIDVTQETPFSMFGLAASALALGAVYWLVREQDQLEAKEESRGPDNWMG
jgi:uncharacterized membrane protein (DUF373 family)